MAYLAHGVAEDGHGKRGEHGEDGENDGNGDEGGRRAGLVRVGRVGGAHALGRREEEDNGEDERGNGSTGEREDSRATVSAMWTRWWRGEPNVHQVAGEEGEDRGDCIEKGNNQRHARRILELIGRRRPLKARQGPAKRREAECQHWVDRVKK